MQYTGPMSMCLAPLAVRAPDSCLSGQPCSFPVSVQSTTTTPPTRPPPLALWAPILTTTKKTNTSDFPDWSENVGTWAHTPMPFNPHVFTMNQKSAYTIIILYWVQFGSPCFGLTYTHDSCAGVWCTANALMFNATLLTDPKHPLYGANRNNFTVPYTAANKYAGSYDDQGLTFSWRPDAAATVWAVLSTVICVCLCICTRVHTHTHTQQQQYHSLYRSTCRVCMSGWSHVIRAWNYIPS